MTERYKLELYLIRDNELEFALYDKEAETSQGTTKMIENKLNKQNELIQEKNKEISQLKKDIYNCYWKSKVKDGKIKKLKMQKSELIETVDFCKDLLYHTNNSKRMKQLRKNIK